MNGVTISYNLLESLPTGAYSVRNGFPSYAAAREFANTRLSQQEQEYKIQRVVTTRTIEEIFTISAMPPPSLEEIADNMASVYSQDIDWDDEDFLQLSESDKAIVRGMVNGQTDDCENCGGTFQSDYLSHTDHGHVCDRCESELEQEEENED
jgi:hypothetical protein